MASEFENIVAEFIRAESLVPDGTKVLLAVSGGADSMAMLHIMHALRKEGLLRAKLFVGHVNHQLRGEASDGDEALVLADSARLGIEASSLRVGVREYAQEARLSTETAARKLRHDALAQMAAKHGCTAVATAHHMDDNAETVMHRMLRGTGFRGLAGIRPARELAQGIVFVRPLLTVSRRRLHEYLTARELPWREDASNANIEHTRNFIRHRLLPHMAQLSAGPLVEELAELAEACRRYADSVALRTQAAWKAVVRERDATRISLDRSGFTACPPAVKVELIQRCLDEIGCGQQAVTAQHYRSLAAMADSTNSGMMLSLPEDTTVHFGRDAIAISRARNAAQTPPAPSALIVPGQTVFGPWRVTARLLRCVPGDVEAFARSKTPMVEWFDSARIVGPLEVRARREGDRFTPFGWQAEQRVGKFLTAARVSESVRERLAIIADGEKVIWVAPVRPSELTRVTADTTQIIEIAFAAAQTARETASE